MTLLTSHVLDAVAGRSAIGIRVALFSIAKNGEREQVFEVRSDSEGRITKEIEIDSGAAPQEFELVFYGYEYLSEQHELEHIAQNMRTSVVRFSMESRDQRYHIPLVLSPHSYTVWWSE